MTYVDDGNWDETTEWSAYENETHSWEESVK